MATEIDLRDSEYRDELPEDLDITKAQAAYQLPSMRRRRIYSVAAAVLGSVCLVLWSQFGNGVLVNHGYGVLGVSLLAMAALMWATSWKLAVREVEAIENATKSVGFPVGHIAAQLGWQGLRSRPTWRVLLYSHENPPRERAVVLVDAVTGDIVFSTQEANPEDWSVLSS